LASKKISIFGLGLIGGSIAKALKNSGSSFYIKGFDKEEVLMQALKEKSIDEKIISIDDCTDSEIIFLCLPTELSLKYFEKVSPLLKEGTIITDVSGVKGIFEEKWKSISSKGIYIGGHPMTGKETSGYESSDELLFENSVYVISDSAKNKSKSDELVSVIKLLGARIRFLNPYLHDKVISRVSHLPQLLAVSLVNSASENGDKVNYLDFAAGGFRDMTRIASSSFNIWESVLKLNKNEIISSIKLLKENLAKLEEDLSSDDYKAIETIFEKARTKRDEIPKNTKGFINPLFDVFIYVKDQAGVLAKLSTIMYENNINIKDVELLKIREGTGGTFRMAFENKETAARAKKLMNEAGFKTK
jgi:prephenate dehydrogenase